MPTQDELSFADQIGRHYVRYYGAPPATGRVAGWLLICDPPEQTAAQIAESLGLSRSAVGNAIAQLERWNAIQRTRPAGQRADLVRADPEFGMTALETSDEYAALGAVARRGLRMLAGQPAERRGRLAELAALCDFLLERLPDIAAEWRERRDALRAAAEADA